MKVSMFSAVFTRPTRWSGKLWFKTAKVRIVDDPKKPKPKQSTVAKAVASNANMSCTAMEAATPQPIITIRRTPNLCKASAMTPRESTPMNMPTLNHSRLRATSPGSMPATSRNHGPIHNA